MVSLCPVVHIMAARRHTKASAARRELAYALTVAGTPIEDAVGRIGEAYRRSIGRWYEESEALFG